MSTVDPSITNIKWAMEPKNRVENVVKIDKDGNVKTVSIKKFQGEFDKNIFSYKVLSTTVKLLKREDIAETPANKKILEAARVLTKAIQQHASDTEFLEELEKYPNLFADRLGLYKAPSVQTENLLNHLNSPILYNRRPRDLHENIKAGHLHVYSKNNKSVAGATDLTKEVTEDKKFDRFTIRGKKIFTSMTEMCLVKDPALVQQFTELREHFKDGMDVFCSKYDELAKTPPFSHSPIDHLVHAIGQDTQHKASMYLRDILGLEIRETPTAVAPPEIFIRPMQDGKVNITYSVTLKPRSEPDKKIKTTFSLVFNSVSNKFETPTITYQIDKDAKLEKGEEKALRKQFLKCGFTLHSAEEELKVEEKKEAVKFEETTTEKRSKMERTGSKSNMPKLEKADRQASMAQLPRRKSSTSASAAATPTTRSTSPTTRSISPKKSTRTLSAGAEMNKTFDSVSTHIRKHLDSVGIFRLAGTTNINKLQEELKTNSNFAIPDDTSIHDTATILKRLNKEMAVFSAVEAKFIQAGTAASDEEAVTILKDIVAGLPSTKKEWLQKLVTLLGEVAENADKNKMDAKNISIVFGPGMLPDLEDPMAEMTRAPHLNKAMERLIANRAAIF